MALYVLFVFLDITQFSFLLKYFLLPLEFKCCSLHCNDKYISRTHCHIHFIITNVKAVAMMGFYIKLYQGLKSHIQIQMQISDLLK